MQSTEEKSIHTLIPDIYELVGKKDGWFTEVMASELGTEISLKMQQRFKTIERKPGLRMSKLGPQCPCALWHSVHHPELADPLPGWAHIKFMYGDLIEAMVIALAKAAGHTVEGEQDAVTLDGVVGHRDCIIDGYVVDVKSANSRSFDTFKKGKVAEDIFSSAYLDQLDGYLVGSAGEDIVKHKDVGYLLVIDKTLGHMVLYRHDVREQRIRNRIAEYQRFIGFPFAPTCTCGTVANDKSGNIILDVKASYNDYKHCCFPHLRTFIYSDGPRYFSKVVKLPRRQDGTLIPEVNRYGQLVS